MKGRNSLSGPLADPAGDAGYTVDHPDRVGFFTDTSVCIGCKACEVACKTWNAVPEDGLDLLGMSFDNTGSLGANSWRHVAFIEQPRTHGPPGPGPGRAAHRGVGDGAVGGGRRAAAARHAARRRRARHAARCRRAGAPRTRVSPVENLGMPAFTRRGDGHGEEGRTSFRWLMASDVCKHCTHAGCLDVCPTGALFRTEFGTVVVQQDICNGCGYCVSGCPYGVIDRRPHDGRAQKCTLCYDRLHDGMEPACAQACPTQSIQFGQLDELRERADQRLAQLHDLGVTEARLYGRDPDDGVGGDGAFFLLLDEPEVYGLPPDPARAHPRREGHVEEGGPGGGGVRAGRDRGVRVRGGRGPAVTERQRARARDAPARAGRRGGGPGARGADVPGHPGRASRRRARRAPGPAPRSRERGRGEPTVVPDAEFRSYYGRPVLKPPVWKHEIPAYLFTGGLAAGTAVVAAGADLTGRPALRRASWLGSFGGLLASVWFLVSDLGRPERFHHMLRVVKPTSPMSVGTWILTGVRARGRAAAALNELVPRAGGARGRPACWAGSPGPLGLSAAATAPGVASYTAVLLSHTAVPGWNEVRDELPFVFTGSAAASGGGFGMLCAPVAENGPARACSPPSARRRSWSRRG